MKLRNIVIIIGLFGGLSLGEMQAHALFDPVSDFRYPETLFEVVHDGIVQIIFMIKRNSNLQAVINGLQELHERFDTTLYYQQGSIKSLDQEFLQNMVDRLQDLIVGLQSDQDLHKQADILCAQLREKIVQ